MRKLGEHLSGRERYRSLVYGRPFYQSRDDVAGVQTETVIVSDFAALEFSSVIARFVRTRSLTKEQARVVLADFDDWSETACQRVVAERTAILRADAFLRRMDMTLRAADAINIVIAEGVGASLMTFDDKMSAAARVLGLPLIEIAA